MSRLFIAVPVDDGVTHNLGRVGTATDAHSVRWVAPENMHLTLAFIGEVEARLLPEVEEAVFAATEVDDASPLQLRAQGIGAFPNEEAARVLWAGVAGDVPRLLAIRSRLVSVLQGSGFAVEPKRFHPHITLARFRRPQPVPSRLARLQEFGEWQATELQVVESHLRPSGARYVVRADVPLLGS